MKAKLLNLIPGLALAAAGLFSTGCLNLKPAADPTRHFVLSPIAAVPTPPTEKVAMRGLGLASIELPAYLNQSAIAIRRSNTEIGYEDYSIWAERLDKGAQRVLASDLSAQMPGVPIKLSLWGRDEVDWELRVRMHRFDFDSQGLATLAASWTITQTGPEAPPQSGSFERTLQGPVPANDMAGAVAGLSSLLGECSREIAQELTTLIKR